MLPLWGAIAPIIGKVIGIGGGVVDKLVEDKDLRNKLKSEMQLTMMNMDHSEFETHLKEAASIVRAEANSQSILARNWRPGLMALFGLIIFNNYILYPYLKLFFPEAPMLELPPYMWELLKISIGGYVVGRSAESVVKQLKGTQ